ncbi:MAG: DUF3131 domain-containing protein [Aristaeellaceae bacterium]
MLTRSQVMLLAGLLLLIVAALLTRIIRSARTGQPLIPLRRRRLTLPRGLHSLMRRCLFLRVDVPELAVLHDLSLPLTEAVLMLRQQLSAYPALPASGAQVRLMPFASRLVREERVRPDQLAEALREPDAASFTTTERLALPLAVSAALCQQLAHSLHALLQDARDRHRAVRLAAVLPREKQPLARLTREQPSLAELAALLTLAHAGQDSPLASILSEWLRGYGMDAELVAERHTRLQTAIADELQQILAHLRALRLTDWPQAEERTDPLNALLTRDPAGLYARMTPDSRQLLRIRADRLAALFHVGTDALCEAALALCEDAESNALERHIGWYLLEPEGMAALRRRLASRRGRTALFLHAHRTGLYRILLTLFSLFCAVAYLNAGNPLLLLPGFLFIAGCLPRAVLSLFRRDPPLPMLEISRITGELRTLVVLPAVLSGPSDALRALRFLRTAQSALSDQNVDLMLLGDYAPGVTKHLGVDGVIIAAASQGVDALSREADAARYLYLQRSRAHTDGQDGYAPRAGRAGAVETLCRLIADGECEDYFDYASLPPAALHRHYAFLLVLDERESPAPGMLHRLLAAASHPFNTRYPTPAGMRGYACLSPETVADGAARRCRTRLIRPDAYLAALDGVLAPGQPDGNGLLTGILSGWRTVAGAHVHVQEASGIQQRTQSRCRISYDLCRIFRWLLPWVQTPGGFVATPLDAGNRFLLREQLRKSAVPLCQCLLMLWALLRQDALLLALVLMLPGVCALLGRGRRAWSEAVEAVCLLPLHASVSIYAAFRAFLPLVRRREPASLRAPESWRRLEIWAQGTAVLLCLLLSAVPAPLWLPGLIAGAAFALFPLLHRRESRVLAPQGVLPAEDEPALHHISKATWRYFEETGKAPDTALPRSERQFSPPVRTPAEITPESAGAYLLALVCARELSFLSAPEAARRMTLALDVLTHLPRPHGLPCRRYDLRSRQIADRTVSARGCGVLLAALMTAAQAVRTWLPELPEPLRSLPSALDDFAAELDVSRLYDPEAMLMRTGLDRDGQGVGHILYFRDEGLLLSVAACARGLVPPAHFTRLSHTRVQSGSEALPLSEHGGLADCLLAELFLPMDAADASRVIWAHQQQGMDGLWGRAQSAFYAFTPDMRLRTADFGLHRIAAGECRDQPVYAPYAAALALPFAPAAALRCLQSFQKQGAFGPDGFCDAVDCTDGRACLAGMQDTFHQGLLLCAAAHVLADAPLRRFFAGLPAVEACLPLLQPAAQPLLLPPRPVYRRETAAHAPQERRADPCRTPVDAHLLGSRDASLVMNALGSSALQLRSQPVTPFTGSPSAIEGHQVYLSVRGRVYRVLSPEAEGETVYADGCIRAERLCGSLRVRTTLLCDPAAVRILYMVEIANLSTLDCTFDLCGYLPVEGAPDTLEARYQAPDCLTLRDRSTNRVLHYLMTLSDPGASFTPCTDTLAFLGRGRTPAHPASLEEPMAPLLAPSAADCLSLRAEVSLGGRGQLRCLFTVAAEDGPPPAWSELPNLLNLSALHARSVAEAIPVSTAMLPVVSRMTGALLWRHQPHQGAREAIDAALATPFRHADGGVLTLTLPDEAALPRLTDCLQAAAWFAMHGRAVTLYVLCTAETADDAHRAVARSLLDEADGSVRVLTDPSPALEAALFAVSSLVLRGDGRSLSAQLDTLSCRVPLPERAVFPAPGTLPGMTLFNPGGYGGFDADSGDYIIRLEAGQTTPAPWTVRLSSGDFTFTADESGLCEPYREQVLLSLDGQVAFHPFRAGLPMTIRIGNGAVRWKAYADGFTLTLHACAMPGYPLGLRTIRLRNTGREAMEATLSVTAELAPSPTAFVTAVEDGYFLQDGMVSACLAGAEGSWTTDTGVPSGAQRDSRRVSLTLHASIPPGRSGSASWLCGNADGEKAAAAQSAIRARGAAGFEREALSDSMAALPGVTVSTPEDTLDLLVNHVLPRQAHAAGAHNALIALTSPEAAREQLLAHAAKEPDMGLQTALMAAEYLRITGDASVLEAPVAEGTLLGTCREALLSHTVKEAAGSVHALCDALLAGYAADAFSPYDDALRDFRRTLLPMADTALWHEDAREAPETLRLDVQARAALVMGHTPQARRALRACWDSLYDRQNGLIRLRLPAELPACPGTPANGGQVTDDAVTYLAALVAAGETERAWELLRALNPLHHTDDPERTEVWRGAPWLLPEGVHALPSEPGRASGEDGTAAARLLELIVTRMLGLTLHEGRVRMRPAVPPDWEGFEITLRAGASTWRICLERGLEDVTGDVPIRDDGGMHTIRLPLK